MHMALLCWSREKGPKAVQWPIRTTKFKQGRRRVIRYENMKVSYGLFVGALQALYELHQLQKSHINHNSGLKLQLEIQKDRWCCPVIEIYRYILSDALAHLVLEIHAPGSPVNLILNLGGRLGKVFHEAHMLPPRWKCERSGYPMQCMQRDLQERWESILTCEIEIIREGTCSERAIYGLIHTPPGARSWLNVRTKEQNKRAACTIWCNCKLKI